MDKFEALNRATREFNNKNIDPTKHNNSQTGAHWLNRRNNETFKRNNGQYPSRLY